MASVVASSERAQARRQLGEAAVLTPAQAAQLLPWDDASAGEWLRRRGLVRRVDGREVVIWGDVLEAIRSGGQDASPPPARTVLRRGKL